MENVIIFLVNKSMAYKKLIYLFYLFDQIQIYLNENRNIREIFQLIFNF